MTSIENFNEAYTAPGDYDVPSIVGNRKIPDSLISSAPGFTFGGERRLVSGKRPFIGLDTSPGVGDYKTEIRNDIEKTPRATIGNAKRFEGLSGLSKYRLTVPSAYQSNMTIKKESSFVSEVSLIDRVLLEESQDRILSISEKTLDQQRTTLRYILHTTSLLLQYLLIELENFLLCVHMLKTLLTRPVENLVKNSLLTKVRLRLKIKLSQHQDIINGIILVSIYKRDPQLQNKQGIQSLFPSLRQLNIAQFKKTSKFLENLSLK